MTTETKKPAAKKKAAAKAPAAKKKAAAKKGVKIPSRKKCSDCKKARAIGMFYKAKNSPDGHGPVCTDCSKIRQTVTNHALAQLRDNHRDEYLRLRLKIRRQLQAAADKVEKAKANGAK